MSDQMFNGSRRDQPKTVLVVEDSTNDFELLRFAIGGEAGVRFRIVNDGDEAIDYLKGAGRFSDRGSNPYPDLVLVDLNLTKVDGFAVLEWIRKARKKPRVFVWTGSEHPEHAVRAGELGAVRLFSKPNRMEGFRAIISEILKALVVNGKQKAESGSCE